MGFNNPEKGVKLSESITKIMSINLNDNEVNTLFMSSQSFHYP